MAALIQLGLVAIFTAKSYRPAIVGDRCLKIISRSVVVILKWFCKMNDVALNLRDEADFVFRTEINCFSN